MNLATASGSSQIHRALGIAAMLLACTTPAMAQEFSADITSKGGNAPPALGRIYVENNKVRIESPDVPDGYFLVDTAAPLAYFVKGLQKVFMDAKQTSLLTQILVPLDPNDPCRQWQAMAVVAGAADQGRQWTCRPADGDTVDGRRVAVYDTISPRNRHGSAWIDPQLKFIVKFQTDDGATVELRNIRKGPQAARLFELPPSYQKFDPKQLIELIKRSDVWVERPK
jgi:hypothetical protein